MGQKEHTVYKRYKKEEQLAKRWEGKHIQKANKLKEEWLEIDKKEKEEYQRTYEFLSKFN